MKETLLLLASLFLAYNYSYSQEKVLGIYFNDSANWKLFDTAYGNIMPSDPAFAYALIEINDGLMRLLADQGTGCAKVKASFQIYNDFLESGVNYELKVSFSEIYANDFRFQFTLNNRQLTIPFRWYDFPNGLNLHVLAKDSFEIYSQPEPPPTIPIRFNQQFVEKSDSFKLEFYIDACRADLWSYADIVVDTIEIWKIPYESVFGETSTSWNLFYEIPDAYLTDSLFVSKDTTIHDLAYKEVFNTLGGNKRYYLRESDDRSKVYLYLPDIVDEEFPVMDLTLALADTFYVGTDRSDTLIVDSVYMADGLKHIRFNYPIEFAGGTEKLEFVEGVGTNFGLFYQGIQSFMIPKMSYLLCAYHDDIQVYANKSMNEQCRVHWTGINDQPAAGEIKMYPNPAKDKLTIEIPGNQFSGSSRLLIYNSSGILVETIEGSSNPLTINVQDKPAGIYLLRVNLNSKYYNLRFVVNK